MFMPVFYFFFFLDNILHPHLVLEESSRSYVISMKNQISNELDQIEADLRL
jgi:hypothetical protein